MQHSTTKNQLLCFQENLNCRSLFQILSTIQVIIDEYLFMVRQYYNKLIQRMIEVSVADIDFYQGKIKTLEEDNFYMHEEIVKLRTRLRTAEDYQIKYSLLVSANQKQIDKMRVRMEKQEEARMKELITLKIKESEQYWQSRFHEFQTKLKDQADQNIQKLKNDLLEKNQQLEAIKNKSQEAQLFGYKLGKLQKENQNLKLQIEQMRQFFDKQRTDEIAKLRMALSNNYRQKNQAQQKKYETKIIQLQHKLHELQLKDNNVTYKASQATNRELISLKALLEENAKQYANELQETRQLAKSKNDQITKILKERIEDDHKLRKQTQQRNEYIKELEDKLLQRERIHEIQLLHQLQRAKMAKDQEKEELQDQINNLHSQIARFRQIWNEKILNHQNEIQQLTRKFEDEKRSSIEDKNMNKRKISQLSLKMKEAQGQRQIGQTEMLINSLKDIDMKSDQLGSYENGITFLQRLNKKCQLKLQEKSRTVSKLHKQINDVRTEAERQIAELKEKIRRDRKENGEKILALQNQVRDLADRLKAKQKQYKKRERQHFNEKSLLQEQKLALKELNDQLQRDYNRVIEGKKEAQASYREQKQKSFASRTDLYSVKKQKWLELEKQKNQLQIIFKEKEEQIKLESQQPLDDLKYQLNKLKQELELAKHQNEQLRKTNKKYHQQLEMNKQNDKMSQFNKKMASLNLEIALTQNIYESLKKAKSRVDPSFSPAEFSVDIDGKSFSAQSQVEQPLLMSFHPSAATMK